LNVFLVHFLFMKVITTAFPDFATGFFGARTSCGEGTARSRHGTWQAQDIGAWAYRSACPLPSLLGNLRGTLEQLPKLPRVVVTGGMEELMRTVRSRLGASSLLPVLPTE
jgi:hypothetical protein